MSYQIEKGHFDPETSFVDVAGTFNGWGSEVDQLYDAEGDAVYSVTIPGFSPGTTIEYKFRIDGAWDGREEFPGYGNNRVHQVTSGTNEIHVWYNDEVPPTGPPIANFHPSSSSIFENGTVWFNNTSGGLVTEWHWEFEGGSPSVSNEKEPVVVYGHAGTFDVTLIASHDDLADTLIIRDYIQVSPRDISETHWWNNTVFYELFVRSFFDSDGDGIGDFRGMLEKLDYLNDGDPNTTEDLGITGIWLMPVHQSPSYHGYDVVDYRSVHSDYGTMDEFKEFLQAAHDRGIKVIIDFVLNHSSNQHPWFQKSAQNEPGYRNYYRWEDHHPGYVGPWGQNVWHRYGSHYYYGLFWSGMPDINFDHQPVKDSLFSAADFWLREIGVDGFRLDAVLYIHEDGDQLMDTEETFHFWQDFNEQVKTSNPDAVTVGEAWTSTDRILPYVSDDRIDIAFEFDLANAILYSVRNGDARQLVSRMQKVYDSYRHLQFATFLTNHDQNRVINVLQGNLNQARTAAAIYLTLPGVPFLYYGEEIGMSGTKPDPEIRTPMQWSSANQAGFTTGTPWIAVNDDYVSVNVADQEEDQESMLNWYRRLISIRNRQPALRVGTYQYALSNDHALYAFLRHYEDERLLVAINTSADRIEQVDITVPGIQFEPGKHHFLNLITDEAEVVSLAKDSRIENLSFEPYQVAVYSISDTSQVSAAMPADSDYGYWMDQNYPNPFNPETNIRYYLQDASDVTIQVYNVLGQVVWSKSPGLMSAGHHTLRFEGQGLSSGIYLYQLHINGNPFESRKMMLLR